MYNRYIPQSDGSYRKNRIPEQPRPPDPAPTPPTPPPKPPNPPQPEPIGGFLHRILPRGFDTGDLLVVLLLLLMAERCDEDKSTAMLTLALYFFM